MKTKKLLLRRLINFMLIVFLSFVSSVLYSQNKKVLISDASNMIISENTYLKVPGDITLGGGVSGTLEMGGNALEITGQLNVNEGSDLNITSGTLTALTTSFSTNSSVTYDGNNQEIKNWEYGNLILNGTGQMSVTGDAASPTLCNTLTVNNTGNKLYVPENKAITIDNTVVNMAGTAGIEIVSSSSGDGSVISYTNNVSASVNRYITGSRWHYLSSPIDEAPLTLFNTNNFLWWDASMEWGGLGDYDPWKTCQNTNLTNVQGYAYYYYEDTIAYKGYMNVSDYNFTLHKNSSGDADNQGWNLIGNPYTAILDWDAAVSGGAIPVGAENAIYFFDDDGTGAQSNYRYYVPSTGGTYGVGTNDVTGKIPLGQAFFIKTNTDNVTLNLNKSFRTHDTQSFYKDNSQEFIKLQVSNNYSDETIIRIVDDASFSFDAEYDARKVFPNGLVPQLYSTNKYLNNIAINSIPEINNNTIINLGLKAEQGEYSISLKDFNFYRYNIYLIDKYEGITINLNDIKSYTFFHKGNQVNDRFYLAFEEQATDIDNLNSNISIYPNPAKNFIKINNNGSKLTSSIVISSINGKVWYKNENAENINTIDLSNFSNGVYFMQIKLNDGSIFYQKIILKK